MWTWKFQVIPLVYVSDDRMQQPSSRVEWNLLITFIEFTTHSQRMSRQAVFIDGNHKLFHVVDKKS